MPHPRHQRPRTGLTRPIPQLELEPLGFPCHPFLAILQAQPDLFGASGFERAQFRLVGFRPSPPSIPSSPRSQFTTRSDTSTRTEATCLITKDIDVVRHCTPCIAFNSFTGQQTGAKCRLRPLEMISGRHEQRRERKDDDPLAAGRHADMSRPLGIFLGMSRS